MQHWYSDEDVTQCIFFVNIYDCPQAPFLTIMAFISVCFSILGFFLWALAFYLRNRQHWRPIWLKGRGVAPIEGALFICFISNFFTGGYWALLLWFGKIPGLTNAAKLTIFIFLLNWAGFIMITHFYVIFTMTSSTTINNKKSTLSELWKSSISRLRNKRIHPESRLETYSSLKIDPSAAHSERACAPNASQQKMPLSTLNTLIADRPSNESDGMSNANPEQMGISTKNKKGVIPAIGAGDVPQITIGNYHDEGIRNQQTSSNSICNTFSVVFLCATTIYIFMVAPIFGNTAGSFLDAKDLSGWNRWFQIMFLGEAVFVLSMVVYVIVQWKSMLMIVKTIQGAEDHTHLPEAEELRISIQRIRIINLGLVISCCSYAVVAILNSFAYQLIVETQFLSFLVFMMYTVMLAILPSFCYLVVIYGERGVSAAKLSSIRNTTSKSGTAVNKSNLEVAEQVATRSSLGTISDSPSPYSNKSSPRKNREDSIFEILNESDIVKNNHSSLLPSLSLHSRQNAEIGTSTHFQLSHDSHASTKSMSQGKKNTPRNNSDAHTPFNMTHSVESKESDHHDDGDIILGKEVVVST